MIQSLDIKTLGRFTTQQLNNSFPDFLIKSSTLDGFVKKSMKRVEYCFSKIKNKYFFDGKNALFNHLNSDQYAMFLYFLSNTIWQEETETNLASKVYCLNKALHGLDVYYEIELPEIFLLVHCVGTILGRADYQDYLTVYQRVTVGGNNGLYPQIGEGVVLYGNSALIGNVTTGNNCFLSYGTTVVDNSVPSNVLVYGRSPNLTFKTTQKSVVNQFFFR